MPYTCAMGLVWNVILSSAAGSATGGGGDGDGDGVGRVVPSAAVGAGRLAGRGGGRLAVGAGKRD